MAASKIEAAPEAASQTQVRQRSTIGFPYMDLESAVKLANAIHDHAGHGDCDDDQLAAWSGQSAKSSTFRVQVYAARTFGILEIENDRHKLTELGWSPTLSLAEGLAETYEWYATHFPNVRK